MALTNFGLLTTEQKTIWSKDLWKQARNFSFINKFLGSGPNSMVQHITELKKSEKGARAVITLLADLEGDGIAGDRTLEGNEEAMKTYDQVIRIDQLRHANRIEGRMADQKSIVEFRNNSKNVLAYWLADRIDQMAFLTIAGQNYSVYNNAVGGPARVGSDLQYLEFATDVTAPTLKRMGRWNGGAPLAIEWGTGTSAVTATDTPKWELFVGLKAYAKDHYIRGVNESGGEETYHAFLTPTTMGKLKLDPTYRDNLRYAQPRGDGNNLFTGTSVKIDGIYLHEFRHVPNTRLSPTGSKWGAASAVDGSMILFCGAQALGMADLGNPEWVEEEFDYGNQSGVSVSKILGYKKPVFYSQYEKSTEDFGTMVVYVGGA
jgi:N4-gp56 family major capsid protein